MEIQQVLHQLVMYLNCIFEVYLLYNFLETLLPIYEDRKWFMRVESIGCITTIFLINDLKIPFVNTVCVPLIYILYMWLIFRPNLKSSSSYCIFYYLILAISEVAFKNIYLFFGIAVDEINLGRVIILIMQDITRFIIIQIVKQRYCISYENNIYKYSKSLYILPVAAMILLNGFIIYGTSPYADILVSLGSILIIVSNVVIFSVIEKLVQAQNTIKDNEMLVSKTRLEKQHFQRIEELNEEYASYIHDICHIFKTIDGLAETENNEEIKRLSLETAGLLKVKSPLDRKKYSEDPILNAIINERKKDAKEKGVDFRTDIKNGIDISFISDLDKIRIFGNLLDNALEAAAICNDGYISMELKQGNDFIVILHIVNNFRHKNIKKQKSYLTIKEDKSKHGFGIKNVQELVCKYNGVMKITEEENVFAVTLILSSVQKTEEY